MAARGEDAVEQGEVADAAVRRQMVEAARVVDEVVRAAQSRSVSANASPQWKRISAPASRARSCAQAMAVGERSTASTWKPAAAR